MTLLSDEEGLEWESGVATLKGTNIKFRLTDQHSLEIQIPCLFGVGMRLEAIDPQHQSTFSVVSVAEVIGTRMRLHIDGYSDLYDFWVNHDSWGLFPCGFCETTGRNLSVPPDEGQSFSWSSYLRRIGGEAAPRKLFRPSCDVDPTGISIGERLEAKQRRRPFSWGVATVVDAIGNRILVHFDGTSDDEYDSWYRVDSPHIGNIGHCEALNLPLSVVPPQFSTWEQYLAEQQAKSIPSLKLRKSRCFKVGQVFEVVDPYCRKLIRRAEIVKVKQFLVWLRFERYPQSSHDFWVEADSEDLHPIGWCIRNVHPLEPSGVTNKEEACPVAPWCRRIGNVKGPNFPRHDTAQACPYGKERVESVLPKRIETKRWLLRVKDADGFGALRKAVHKSIFAHMPGHQDARSNLKLDEKLDIESWDCNRVAAEVAKVTCSESIGHIFLRNGIDGVAFMCLQQEDLTDVLGIRLGPSLKIYSLLTCEDEGQMPRDTLQEASNRRTIQPYNNNKEKAILMDRAKKLFTDNG